MSRFDAASSSVHFFFSRFGRVNAFFSAVAATTGLAGFAAENVCSSETNLLLTASVCRTSVECRFVGEVVQNLKIVELQRLRKESTMHESD